MNIFQKIFLKISSKFKYKFIQLLILFLLNSFFELLGISLIIPIYKTIVEYQSIINNPDNNFFNYLSTLNLVQNEIIIIFFILLVAIFIIKFLIYSYSSKFSLYLVADLKTQISTRIFNDYASREYIFFKQKNSSAIVRDLLIEVGEFCQRFVLSYINILLEILVVIALFSFLFFIEMKITIYFTIYIILSSLIFFGIIKKRILKAGKLRSDIDEKKFSILNDFIRNIKTIKIKNSEIYFSKAFKEYIEAFEKSYAIFNYVQVLSKPVLEILGIIFIFSWILMNLYLGVNLNDLFLSVSLVIFVCLRTLPSINKIVYSYGQIKYAKPSIRIVEDELDKLDHEQNYFKKKSIITFNKSLLIDGIDFKYSDNEAKLFTNLNFKINKGDKICILGKSGEGKTTFIELISGLLKPDKGRIILDENKIFNPKLEYLNLAYIPQDLLLINGSVADNIAFNNQIVDKKKLEQSIKFSELSSFVDSLKNKELGSVGELGGKLSGGQRQRIGLARCFYDNPDFIILDEALNAIDEKTRIKILDNIFKFFAHKTIIYITHDNKFSEYFDKKYYLKKGNLKSID
jgi:ATP-binding cassette, subfamily B, bacterial PglK